MVTLYCVRVAQEKTRTVGSRIGSILMKIISDTVANATAHFITSSFGHIRNCIFFPNVVWKMLETLNFTDYEFARAFAQSFRTNKIVFVDDVVGSTNSHADLLTGVSGLGFKAELFRICLVLSTKNMA